MGTRKNRLSEAVLTSTHNLCFKAKIRKNENPVNPSFTIYIKVGCKWVFVTRNCFHDGIETNMLIDSGVAASLISVEVYKNGQRNASSIGSGCSE